ncbi:MAG: hypothetical protein GYA43_02220 [Bacteroidales bacterium]|nr:hypothetical protein [Bacteroidales bacterium]
MPGIERVVTVQDISPVLKTIHPVAKAAIAKGEKPAVFSGVTYRYAGNVRVLKENEKSLLKLGQDGILDLSGKAFIPHPDSVYVDQTSNLIFKAEPVDEKRMLMFRPTLSSVFEDIEIPAQEVRVNLANTVSLAGNVVASSLGLNDTYALNLQFDSTKFLLDKAKEGEFYAILVGKITLTNPRVEGRYSKNGGYRLVFKTTEDVNLKVYTTIKAAKEIKTPLWGAEIDAGGIGKCTLGVFMLINMEGKVSLNFEIQQGIDMEIGAKGNTVYFIPTSLNNISNINHWCNIGYNIESEIKAFAGIHCTANLEIKGYDALNVYATGGMEGTVSTTGMVLNADVGFRIKAGGKIVSKSFNIINNYYSLWKLQKPDLKGYEMKIFEACAYGDYVAGEVSILTDSKQIPGKKEKTPYKGPLSLIVRHTDNKTSQYQTSANNEGFFLASNISLRNGDMVMVKMPDVASPGPAVAATIPFREISLCSADYFTGTAEGYIAGSRSEWSRLAAQSGTALPDNVRGLMQGSQQGRIIKGSMDRGEAMKRINEFKNSIIVYRGQIGFVSRPVSKENINLKTINLTGDLKMGENPGKGNVNHPLGFFSINGLNLNPGQEVKAKVEIEGFIVESDWIETDGIIVSGIENVGLRRTVSPGNETISAENCLVVVSALRGNSYPSGTVKMLKGVAVPHGSVTGTDKVPEFPDAVKARLFFNLTTDLKPVQGQPNCAIAETGRWNTVINYSSPLDAVNPAKNGKHPFEMVSYVFKNNELGYSMFMNECASCNSPENIVRKTGTSSKSSPLPGVKVQGPVNAPGQAPAMMDKTGKMINKK